MKAQVLQRSPVFIELEIEASCVGIKSEMRHRALLERGSEVIKNRFTVRVYSVQELDLERL